MKGVLNHKWNLIVLLVAAQAVNAHAQFVERSAAVGIEHRFLSEILFGGGVGILDINNDNRLDLYFTGGRQPDQLYLNNGTGFDRIISYLWPEDFDYYELNTQGVATGDVNNDGYDDIFVTTVEGSPNFLMVNNGDNTFDVIPPEESGLTGTEWSISACMGDVNKDGLLDIFVGNYIDEIRSYIDTATGLTVFAHTGFRNRLFLNEGNLQFSDASDDYGMTRKGTTLAAAFTDYDLDRDPDLYVVNDFGHFIVPNELYRNESDIGVFTDVSESSGADIGLYGMGVAIGDYDGDLDLDYYITNIGRNSLLVNRGDGTFSDEANAAGVQDSSITDEMLKVGWGTGFFDFDNDGDLDLYVSNGHIPAAREIENPVRNPNSLYQNHGDGTYSEVAAAMGVDLDAICRGSAFGDLDGDGDLDLIFVPNSTGAWPTDTSIRKDVAVYYNETPGAGNWIAFRTVGTESNRNGYGALVYLYDNSGRVQLREVDGGSSHASSNSPFVHFGLGSADAVDSAVIFWPSGLVQSVVSPDVNRLHVIVEAGDTVIQSALENTGFEFNLHPNPANSIVTVTLSEGISLQGGLSWQLRLPDGRTHSWSGLDADTFDLDVSGLPAGIYYLMLFSEGRPIGVKQIAVR